MAASRQPYIELGTASFRRIRGPGRPVILTKEKNMGKGNNRDKNDKKNMKVKKGGKKQEAKTANKK
jgi:hypothetical protein